MIAEINCETKTVIEREMTAEEISANLAIDADYQAKREAQKAELERTAALKESAKAKLIAGDPLTAEEASVIVL